MADVTSSCHNSDDVATDDRLSADVLAACRDGDVSQLRSLVDGRSKDEIRRLLASSTNGASSLIMACRNGHASVVSFLVTRCHADIEQVGSVTFDGEVRTGTLEGGGASISLHCQLVGFGNCIVIGAVQTDTPATQLKLTKAALFYSSVDFTDASH